MSREARRRPAVVGHRGAAARAPENTAASLREGIASGADAVEIDVGLSSDGRVVVLHDATLDRTTTGRGPVAARAWRDLEGLDAGSWFSKRFRGEPLLDLDGALAIARGRVPIVVELKGREPAAARALHRAEERLLDGVLAALERTGGWDGITLSSFRWPLLEAAAESARGLDLALTVGLRQEADPVVSARRIGASALHASRRLCTSPFVARAQAEGLLVLSYVVNRAADLDPLLAAGIDGVFTDDPAAMVRLVGKLWPDPRPRRPFTLGIDQGSSGTRAVLLSSDDRIVATRYTAVASRRGPGGALIQDAEAIAASVLRVSIPLVENSPEPVAGVGIASQRSSLVLWRRSDGRPVEPLISWRSAWDPRALEPLHDWEASIARTTGLTSRFPYGALRLADRLASGGAVAEGLRAGKIGAGPIASFLAARLAGRHDGDIDPSLAQRMLLLDIRRLRWAPPLVALTGVPEAALPSLLPTTAARGRLRLGRQRPELRALVGDASAAFRAVMGADGEGGVIVLGTGGFLLAGTGRRPMHVPGLLTTLLWEDAEGPLYAVEGSVHGLASSLEIGAELAGATSLSPELQAARSGAARRTPWILPATEGLGTPDWDPTSRFEVEPGDWSGPEILAGTIAGIAERFGRIGDLLRRAGLLPARFSATGGLSASPHLVQAIASRLGSRVEIDRRPHRAAAGAAMLAR